MTTEAPTVNYKIGNERLISVTEKAAAKLTSLLEEKGKSDGALRLAVVGGGCSGLQYVMDLVDGPKARFSSAVPCSITARIYKRAASKSQTRTPWLIALAAKASRSRTCFRPTNRAIEPCADADELYLHDLSFLMLEMIIN